MLANLREQVYKANMMLDEYKLITFTWGNVSAIDRESNQMVIKPSGVAYEELAPKNMVVVDIETGETVEGDLNPSSDTATHVELYKHFPAIGGITHTHSTWATAWAQAGKSIPALGTTQADYLYGDIPCTRALTDEEIKTDYEKNTGLVIIETFKDLVPEQVNAVLVRHHGPFTWGVDAADSVHNAIVLDEVAKMALLAQMAAGAELDSMPQTLLDKHYFRKHGEDAYYGQK